LQIIIGLVGVAYLMPVLEVMKKETHMFRWATGPDLNDSLCAIAYSQPEHENNSSHFSVDLSKSFLDSLYTAT